MSDSKLPFAIIGVIRQNLSCSAQWGVRADFLELTKKDSVRCPSLARWDGGGKPPICSSRLRREWKMHIVRSPSNSLRKHVISCQGAVRPLPPRRPRASGAQTGAPFPPSGKLPLAIIGVIRQNLSCSAQWGVRADFLEITKKDTLRCPFLLRKSDQKVRKVM